MEAKEKHTEEVKPTNKLRSFINRIPSKYIYIGGLIFLFIVPLLAGNYILHVLILSLIFAILTLSWNMVVGFAGIFSFGHHAFFGIGAYCSALLALHYNLSPWFGLVIGGFLASMIGVFIGLPVLRLRAAPYIAILTLGFAEITKLVSSNLVDITRGELGLSGIPAFSSIGPIAFNLANRINIYYLALIILVIAVYITVKIINGPRGLALKSIKESQDAAESLGVNLTKNKLYVFMISAYMAGVAGSLYAHYIQILTPSSILDVNIMIQILVITVLGGLGTIIGPIVGSFIIVIGLEYLRFMGDYRLMIYGIVIILVIMFMPQGIIKKVFPKANI